MSKIIKKGKDVKERLISGINKTADTIKTTIGPSGKCVAIVNELGLPEITRDGATVAKSIELKDPIENVAASMIKEAAERTEEIAGDGTSTTSVLIQEFVTKGQKAILTGYNMNEIRSGMFKAKKWMLDYITSKSIPVDGDLSKIKKVATISANNNEEIGELVVESMKRVGVDGLITVDTTASLDTKIEVTPGMKLPRGWSSPLYINKKAEGTCVMDNPYILVVGERISSVNSLVEILKSVTDPQLGGGAPLLIVCDDIDDSVQTMLIYNNKAGALQCCVVKGVEFGDARKNMMADLAVATGASYFCPENGNSVSKAGIQDLGKAGRVVVSRNSCIIYDFGGDSEIIKDRSNVIKKRLEDPAITKYEKDKFRTRLANLTGGIAIIKAGGASEAEKNNIKSTIEDSVLAAKSAIELGCCPGGGSIYFCGSIAAMKDKKFWKSLKTESEKEGARIIFSSLPIILKTIGENSGISGDYLLAKATNWKPGMGYNARTGKIWVDLMKEGILDSTKVLITALNNSVSAASMLLLIDDVVYEDKREDGCCCCCDK